MKKTNLQMEKNFDLSVDEYYNFISLDYGQYCAFVRKLLFKQNKGYVIRVLGNTGVSVKLHINPDLTIDKS